MKKSAIKQEEDRRLQDDHASSPPLGRLIEILRVDNLVQPFKDPDFDEESTKITECNYIASYNWLENNNTTILVPGKEFWFLPLWMTLLEI